VVGHTCKITVLDEPIAIDELRAAVDARLGEAPELTRRLGGSDAAPAWIPASGFRIEDHVVESVDEGVDRDDDLPEVVARLFAERLDRDRPLWQLTLVRLRRGTALVWRIHHAVADGTTCVRLGRAVLWDPEAEPHGASGRAAPPRADDARRVGHLAGFLRREFAESHGRSPFDARIGTRRRVAFAGAPLAALHDAAKDKAGATVNDVVLSVVGGGLRRWMESAGVPVHDLRVKVPVSLHREGEDAGNRDSFFALALPLHEADPVERLRQIHAATAERKADHDAEALDAFHHDLARVSPRLDHLVDRMSRNPRRFALNVSNVPGPRSPVTVLGNPARRLHTLAEIGERHALRVSVVSYAGSLCFGLCADPEIVPGLDVLAAGIETEAELLVSRRASA
jgi:diacylglycerol O-acyltransferase / wax synthase